MTSAKTSVSAGAVQISRTPLRQELPPGLDALDRILLTTDGTVTTLLQACTGERVLTQLLDDSGLVPLTALGSSRSWWQLDLGSLAVDPDVEAISRRVVLRGSTTGTPYVLAESVVVPSRLPEVFALHLARPGGSIGRVLAANDLESRREVLETGLHHGGEAAETLGVGAGEALAWRTYRIVLQRKTAILISELIVPGRLQQAARRRLRRTASGARAHRVVRSATA